MKKKTILTINFFIIFILLVSGHKKFTYYYQKLDNNVHILKLKKNNKNISYIPYLSTTLESVEDISKKTNSFAVINTGYFDPNNQKTISYIYKNGNLIADPQDNKNLVSNNLLLPHLDKIFNRAEFRINDCRGKKDYEITFHQAPQKPNCKLIHSLQAGPIILPDMNLEKEFFILKQDNKIIRQSAGVMNKTARSAIGYDDKNIYLIAIENKPGMTIKELSLFVKKLGLKKAMAFDGGSSTSFYLNLPNKKINIKSAKDSNARKIKSALIISYSSQ